MAKKPVASRTKRAPSVDLAALSTALTMLSRPREAHREWASPQYAPGVLPKQKTLAKQVTAALDACIGPMVGPWNTCDIGMAFPGYPYLAELAQRPEYRKMSSIIAEEMVRKWIKITGSQDDVLKEKVKELENELERLNVRDIFEKAAESDGLYGCGHIYIDLKSATTGVPVRDDPELLKLPLVIDKAVIKKGSLLGLRHVEPIWVAPYNYNSIDPMNPAFYVPQSWFVMGKLTHSTRLMTLISREVPDMLKAAYNFGGLSLSQIAEPYVNNWLRTRNSVSDMIHSYSLTGVKMDLMAMLQPGASCSIERRMELFNKARDNRGLMLLDKSQSSESAEEFFQFNAPLGTLDALQSQAAEQLSLPSGIPLVKMWGITPAGLNATSEGELTVFYDFITAMQHKIFREPLARVLKIVQLNLWGVVDPDISFEFVPMQEMNEKERAEIRKSTADADAVYITNGVIDAGEVRTRMANDPSSGYEFIDSAQVPDTSGLPPTDPASVGDPETDEDE